MKSRTVASLILCSFAFFGCNTADARKARAFSILKEISEIAPGSSERLTAGDIREVMGRLDGLKKTFPDNRLQIRNDAQTLKEFLQNERAADERTQEKLGEVLALGLSKEDADCIEGRVNFQKLLVQRIDSYIGELDLLLDESVVDRKTLQARSAPFQDEGDKLTRQAGEMQDEIVNTCSKSSFKLPNLTRFR